MPRKALGKGLRALIPEPEAVDVLRGAAGEEEERAGRPPGSSQEPAVEASEQRAGASTTSSSVGSGLPVARREALKYVRVSAIVPNPRQPRSNWEPEDLEALAQSIRTNGLLEPIIVRQVGNQYEIVAGERRWRACKIAGWTEIPVIVRPYEDQASLLAALVENVQRSDLNPVDEARAYRILATDFGLSHQEIAERVGKDRATVSNLLRLLGLPRDVLELVSRGTLSVGHARALLGLPPEKQSWAARRVVEEGWSVRKTEAWVRREKRAATTARKSEPEENLQRKAELRRIEEQLKRHLGTRVRLTAHATGGRLEISFASDEELSRILALMGIVIY